MKTNPRVSDDRSLMTIGYTYNSRKVTCFIATEGSGGTEPGDSYLSYFLEVYSNVSVCPVVCLHFLGRDLNACNAIDNQNKMRQSDLALEK